MRSYRAVALNPLVLSQIMTGNLKRSIVTTHRLNTKKSSRIRIHDPIQNEWNRWTFRLPNTRYISTFSITSEKPDPPELSRIITSNGSRLGDGHFLLDRTGV